MNLDWWKVTFTIDVQTYTKEGETLRDAMDKAWAEMMAEADATRIPNTSMVKVGVVVEPMFLEKTFNA